jgi:hypothetical protein
MHMPIILSIGGGFPASCICAIIFCIISNGLPPWPIWAIIFLAIAMPIAMGPCAPDPLLV